MPLWDSNPELLYIDSLVTGGPAIDLTSNATVTGIVGVMDFSFGSPEIILDASNRPSVSGLMSATPVPARASTEFNIASFNMERFYNDVADADNPGSSAVTVTTAAYQRRLAKASLAVRNVLLSPDLVGCEEIENLAVLTDLAKKISADAIAAGQEDPKYTPYLFLATDGTAINTGVLVKSTRVTTVRAEQFGLTTTFTNSGGSQATLNDRTPLVLHAGIKRSAGPDYPVTFIVVHQRSLINVDDPTSTGATVRLKREAQAEYLANLVQSYQAAGEHVIVVGDFNTFEFSDGFVDVMGVTTGKPVPATQVITPPANGLVNPSAHGSRHPASSGAAPELRGNRQRAGARSRARDAGPPSARDAPRLRPHRRGLSRSFTRMTPPGPSASAITIPRLLTSRFRPRRRSRFL